MAAYTPYCSNLNERPGLISLAEAAQNPAIKYHSLDRGRVVSLERRGAMKKNVVHVRTSATSKVRRALRLIPLSVAQRRNDIKRRQEGFEMAEVESASESESDEEDVQVPAQEVALCGHAGCPDWACTPWW